MEIIFTDRFLNRVEEYSDYIALDNILKQSIGPRRFLRIAGALNLILR
jgi:hypothetical protein